MLKRLILAFALLLPAAVAAEPWMGDDGLHKTTWMRDTFKDLNEDLAEATELGLRLMVMIEQRGCIYCTKMHEEVFTDFEIESYIEENFFVIQLNMFGDVEVTEATERDVVGIHDHRRATPHEVVGRPVGQSGVGARNPDGFAAIALAWRGKHGSKPGEQGLGAFHHVAEMLDVAEEIPTLIENPVAHLLRLLRSCIGDAGLLGRSLEPGGGGGVSVALMAEVHPCGPKRLLEGGLLSGRLVER